MRASRTKGRNLKKTKSQIPWWVWTLVVSVLWLLLSSLWQKSPTQFLTDAFRYVKGESSVYKSPSEQMATLDIYKDSIAVLHKKMSDLKNQTPYRKAIVVTEANSLNMRASSSISGEVVIKIPDSSMVEILYYDQEVLVLDGETGKWCKIKYADKEGWVWGNYLEIVD